jgi:hypothetical protein
MQFRTDRNNNPAAFTVDIAAQGGLTLGIDYEQGDPFFVGGKQFFTARLLGDPVALTIRVIDKIGFYTHTLAPRWAYIGIPAFIWAKLSGLDKRAVIDFMYEQEGGEAMKLLFQGNVQICIGDAVKLDESH